MEENSNKNLQTREHHINELNKEAKTNLMSRIIIAACLVAVVIPCLILGEYFWLTLILLMAIIMTHEICKAPQSIERKFKNVVFFFAYFMVIALTFYIFLKDIIIEYNHYLEINGTDDGFTFNILTAFKAPQLSLTAFCISTVFFFLEVLIDPNFTIHDAFYFIVMMFVISLGLQCLIYLRFLPFLNADTNFLNDPSFKYGQSSLLIVFVLLGTCLNDVGAYLIGILFGKHKFAPRISPKKTWEGFFGGIFTGFIASFLFGILFSYFGFPLLKGVLDFEHWYNILILAIALPLAGTFGDLLFSSLKRGYKIKDFGTILKSHGGLLDRFDSILIGSITASLIILIMINGVSIVS